MYGCSSIYLNDNHEEQEKHSLNGSVSEDGANARPVKLKDVCHKGVYTITGEQNAMQVHAHTHTHTHTHSRL